MSEILNKDELDSYKVCLPEIVHDEFDSDKGFVPKQTKPIKPTMDFLVADDFFKPLQDRIELLAPFSNFSLSDATGEINNEQLVL